MMYSPAAQRALEFTARASIVQSNADMEWGIVTMTAHTEIAV